MRLSPRRNRPVSPSAERDDPDAYVQLFRGLISAAREHDGRALTQAVDAVERHGRRARLRVAALGQHLVSTFAYPDYPGREVDMRNYIGMIKVAYANSGDYFEQSEVTYADFCRAVGNWATADESVPPAIIWACHVAFLAEQWPKSSDEPSDADLVAVLVRQKPEIESALSELDT